MLGMPEWSLSIVASQYDGKKSSQVTLFKLGKNIRHINDIKF